MGFVDDETRISLGSLSIGSEAVKRIVINDEVKRSERDDMKNSCARSKRSSSTKSPKKHRRIPRRPRHAYQYYTAQHASKTVMRAIPYEKSHSAITVQCDQSLSINA